ncbi:MAG: hypothetical protein JO184_17975 [Gammaproteobacteria bacterium]|nr:hypothetical protein [Gammaproteobacteria bacterium]
MEAVIGAPLAVPPYRASGGGPSVNGDDCIYETADFHRIILHVDFTDGAQAYNMGGFANKLLGSHPDAATRKAFRLQDGTELTGEWDEARLMAMNCCIFMTMRGDQGIRIDFTSSDASLPQAAGLVNAAYQRIDKPLKIDGAAAISAAKAHAKQRPAKTAACQLLSRDEVEALIGKLTSEPTGKDSICSYQVAGAQPGWKDQYDIDMWWTGGYSEFRSAPYVESMAAHAMMANAPPELQPKDAQAQKPAEERGPWERAGDGRNGFMAVKKDAMVVVTGRQHPELVKLAAAVMSKI